MTSFILVQGSIDMVFVWVVEIDLVFIRGPEITCFSVSIEIDSLFCAGGRSCLDFSKGVELDLI